MTTSMLDQRLFNLRCGHHVVLGWLANKNLWTCENCGEETDLAAEPLECFERERDLGNTQPMRGLGLRKLDD
jgi:hypothetical protein